MPEGPKIIFTISELKTRNVLASNIDRVSGNFGKISIFLFLVALVERSLDRSNWSNENLNNLMMLSRSYRLTAFSLSLTNDT